MSNKELTIPTLTCKRCDHTWMPRRSVITLCPKCKSPYWNKERTKKVKEQLVNKVLNK